jgi:hypothetical protein
MHEKDTHGKPMHTEDDVKPLGAFIAAPVPISVYRIIHLGSHHCGRVVQHTEAKA